MQGQGPGKKTKKHLSQFKPSSCLISGFIVILYYIILFFTYLVTVDKSRPGSLSVYFSRWEVY